MGRRRGVGRTHSDYRIRSMKSVKSTKSIECMECMERRDSILDRKNVFSHPP